MQTWQLQDAKARFSELIDTAERQGPQMITRRGVETAVLIPIDQWRRTVPASHESLLEILQSTRIHELDIPKRGRLRHRRPVELCNSCSTPTSSSN